MNETNVYKSLLHNISLLTTEQLNKVDKFIKSLKKEKTTTKSYAGIWSDLPEDDFYELLSFARKSGEELFSGNPD